MEDNSLEKSAIQATLDGDWEKAVGANVAILKKNPQDCDALNRLARVYFELGETEKVKDCYCQVLKLDPANSIATKNLKLLIKSPNGTNGKNGHNKNFSLDIFLSDPGRTKLVNLVNLTTPTVLSQLACGEKVQMVVKKHQVIIETTSGDYLGAVPDDLSHYLISLTCAGNIYETYIKAVKTNILTVIVWEKKRAAKFANQPSFLSKKQARLSKIETATSTLAEADLSEGLIGFEEA